MKRALVFLVMMVGWVWARSAAAQDEARDDDEYGRQGSMSLGLSFGLGTSTEGTLYGGGAEIGYFFLRGLAPGISVDVSGGSGRSTTGLLMGTLRWVPLHTGPLSLFLIGRAGRVLVANHVDGWGAGGGAGVVVATGGNLGLQISYEVLALMPQSFCNDFSSGCRLGSLGIGLVMGL